MWILKLYPAMDEEERTVPCEVLTSTIPLRPPSQASSLSSNAEVCRICHWEGDSGTDELVAPCYCSGSLRWVHQHCLQQWIKSSDIKCCELCKFQFVMSAKLKSFNEWEGLQMSTLEKRKLICSVLFHGVALMCVLWSLYVLIERTAEELDRGALDWPFWTKLVVVAFGFFGGVVFMYIQCKAYVNLCRRWRAFNRVIFIQNAPEKPGLPPECVPPSPPTCDAKPPLVSAAAAAPLVTHCPPGACIVTIPTEPKRSDPHDTSSDDGETYALLNV